jgi:hypothetical protein
VELATIYTSVSQYFPRTGTLKQGCISTVLFHIICILAFHLLFYNDVIHEIEQLTNLIIEQNYFEIDSKFYYQSEGLAMGAPSSAFFLAEIYLQFLEHNQIMQLLKKHKIISYHRYVDDILIIYDTTNTNINNTLTDFNNIHHKIQFTIENEQNSLINFLDLTVTRQHNRFQFGIYRKNTATDILLRNNSCHPTEHKMSGIKYLINRISTYPLTNKNRNRRKPNSQPPSRSQWLQTLKNRTIITGKR